MEKDKLKEILSNLKKESGTTEMPDIREWITECCRDWTESDEDNRACLCILGERKDEDDAGTSVIFLKSPKSFMTTCLYNILKGNKEFCEDLYLIAKSVLEEDKKLDIVINSSSKKIES